jgi:hypothetical protein
MAGAASMELAAAAPPIPARFRKLRLDARITSDGEGFLISVIVVLLC